MAARAATTPQGASYHARFATGCLSFNMVRKGYASPNDGPGTVIEQ